MARKKKKYEKTVFDRARDELFSHIHRCAVLDAEKEQQDDWMDDTIQFMAERYPEMTKRQLNELQALGMRFCQPVIGHGKDHTAVSQEDANAA